MNSINDSTVLHNGVQMPWFGLGVYKVQDGDEVQSAIATALQQGYRSIDTAAFYENEEGVGIALKSTAIPRRDVFVTTKVWNTDQGYDETLRAFDSSYKKLGLDVVDLYLVHWPMGEKSKQTWKALERLYDEGLVRAIGVSNFLIHHLQDLMASANVVPMVNQVEFHPYLSQPELQRFCKEHKIQLEAWSPLMRGKILTDPVVLDLAQQHGKTPAQVVLRWDLQHEVVTIPKSVHANRIIENADIFDFELSETDMGRLDSLDRSERVGPNPDDFANHFR